jgi:phosphoribosylanthranilate isomerase
MRTRVKICGINRLEDALAAAEAGADALGFMFYPPSPRHVSLEEAARIIAKLPPFVSKVGVFVDEEPDRIRQAVEVAGIDALQLHGSESPEFCGQFPGVGLIKAFRMRDEGSLKLLAPYDVSAWLLDSYAPGVQGGTGHSFDWEWAIRAGQLGKPIILAGGLNPANIGEAIRNVRPYGVDVSSGVEKSKGIKDASLIQRFIHNVRAADE